MGRKKPLIHRHVLMPPPPVVALSQWRQNEIILVWENDSEVWANSSKMSDQHKKGTKLI